MTLPLAGAKVKAADLLGVFPQNTDAWTAYTPTWTCTGTAPSLGNGSLTGAFSRVGRIIHWRLAFNPGSTTTYGTGNFVFTVPVQPLLGFPLGLGTILDASVPARFNRYVIWNGGTTFVVQTEAGLTVGQLVPMTWASGDSLTATGMYEGIS